MQDKTKKIVLLSVVLVIILVLMKVVISSSSTAAGMYDAVAKCIKDKGATFYGAFWCPHCQSQKKEFGNSAKYLPYHECSNADTSSNQGCKDVKIESYPTWTFADGIKVEDTKDPLLCQITPGPADENPLCKNLPSKFFKRWVFGNMVVASDTEPLKVGNIWSFPASAQARGEISIEDLAKQTSCEASMPAAK